ncbi:MULTISPECIES: molybdate ABC transporter substrate-binding protein [unclassified Streptomyces]|uniref:molybdate ABC transporter substrate-binding protein n=1 Tax=unclassified Streptomyces TaxID=2593676 RepID=UPI0022B66FCC|nr:MULTISPECIES: molybdate ABC transporter substrate-binding protein [unclassified Streptomyces]MCZ7417415.1 molybdate ABC transporter substrate-binding protein [Streptomyces sp. WMMC897]MCZ7432757.1 molybdate ABC transporter substrate-binding protein [Streptomyces sp. WMMC1477]
MSTARRTARRRAAALLAIALLVPLAACGSGGSGGNGDGAGLTVLAASSLTDAFEEAGAAYAKDNPGTEVTFSFAGSQELVSQVRQGAPADVIATADTRTMDGIADDTEHRATFATNRLVIVVGEGNPHGVAALTDLADPGLKVVLAAPEVPVGGYGRQVLDRQDVAVRAVSEEPNVRAVLSKVELGEADAGIVYRTDAATAAENVDAVAIPEEQNQLASYPVAVLKESGQPEAAAGFVEWLRGPEARKILADHGFQQP